MKGYWLYIVVLILLIGGYTLAQWYRPQPVDWSPSYSSQDKIPLGTYILHHELDALFPGVEAEIIRESLYEKLNNNRDTNSVYLLIDNRINFSKADRDALLKYVGRGNSMFIAVNGLANVLTDTLHCAINNLFMGKQKTTLSLSDKKISENHFGLDSAFFQSFIDIEDTASTIVLGKIDDNPNFVRFDIGKGHLYLNTIPQVFTNYYLLKKGFPDYVSAALSYLPAKPRHLYWDEYFKLGRAGPTTPLRVILTQPDLKWAYWLAIITLVIFVFFEGKRRQRIIPEIKPLRNATLDFVSTVGQLYYSRRDNKNIAKKMISYWEAFLWESYRLKKEEVKDDSIDLLSAKSGVPEKTLKELEDLINEINILIIVDDQRLMRLNHLLEIFYHKANN